MRVQQDLPREREDLLGKLPEQGILGGVCEHQYNIDVARHQLDQVTGVGYVCQLRHLHKVLLRRTAVWINEEDRERRVRGQKIRRCVAQLRKGQMGYKCEAYRGKDEEIHLNTITAERIR